MHLAHGDRRARRPSRASPTLAHGDRRARRPPRPSISGKLQPLVKLRAGRESRDSARSVERRWQRYSGKARHRTRKVPQPDFQAAATACFMLFETDFETEFYVLHGFRGDLSTHVYRHCLPITHECIDGECVGCVDNVVYNRQYIAFLQK